MLHSNARWKTLSNDPNEKLVQDITYEVSPIVESLLLQRGIRSLSEAKRFLTPSLEALYKPEHIHMMDKAVSRVNQAISENEKILVYGDYDADGVSSTALLIKALEELGANCTYYIPNRFTEGYGPNEQAFRQAKANGFTLIITVDNGITAVHETEVANEIGVDVIITDHHEVQEELPDAYAIIHPALSENYPFKELAGVGVAFKFAQSLLGRFPEELLELVAIGTVADLVPLKDENRTLTYYGLRALSSSSTPGILALKQVSGIEGSITEEDIGFRIGPRLNAVGRLQDASLAVELLLTDSMEEAKEFAEEVDRINQERKQIVEEIAEEAELLVDATNKMVIVYQEGWNEGVLGIVASRLVRKFDRPAIVLNYNAETNELKGSARSIPAFDLFKNCMQVRHLFTKFGGHAQAAGMTIPMENIEEIQVALNQLIDEQLTDEDFKQEILVSGKLEVAEINEQLIDEIHQLAPYGMGNPEPIFEIIATPTDKRQIGSKRNHLKLQFKEEGVSLDAVGFGMGHHFHRIAPNTDMHAVGALEINEWNGNRKPQLMLKDVSVKEWQLFDYRGRKGIDLSFLKEEDTLLIADQPLPNINTPAMNYDSLNLKETPHLILMKLPATLNELVGVLEKVKPVNIYACFQIEESAYLQTFPTREDFVWLYALLHKRRQIDFKTEMKAIMKLKSWSKEHIIFIVQVFSDLDFIETDNGVATIVENPNKKDLKESITYQERLQRLEIEQTLFYSNYEQFKNWFEPYMRDIEKPKEEIVNGL